MNVKFHVRNSSRARLPTVITHYPPIFQMTSTPRDYGKESSRKRVLTPQSLNFSEGAAIDAVTRSLI